jgi:hypothetical protein
MTAFELVFTYDPTPATWMYDWDVDRKEDAAFACSFGFIFKHMPTTMDAGNAFLEDGKTPFAFPAATPARDIWESHAKIVSKPKPGLGLVADLFAGQGEPNGDDPRLIDRFGADVRLIYNSYKIQTVLKVNDWGPYDYHKDFNLTYPMQFMVDLSTSRGIPDWFDFPETKLGIRATYRTLDQYSPRYCPTMIPDPVEGLICDPTATGFGYGNEWEIRTYLHFNVSM